MGPQDLERGVSADLPTPEIESLLCALLGLVNNRKKPIELVSPEATFLYQDTVAWLRSAG